MSGANGVKAPVSPIPTRALGHCACLLGGVEDLVSYFLAALGDRMPALDTPTLAWTGLEHPRACTFTDLAAGAWNWRVVIDPAGCTEALLQSLEESRRTFRLPVASAPWGLESSDPVPDALAHHQVSVLVFLTAAPEDTTAMERMRALNQLAWAWLDAGASLVAWPEGRVSWGRDFLLEFRPGGIDCEEAGLFVSAGAVEVAGQGLVRTYGMGQFELPDLVLNGQPGAEMQALLGDLVPRMVALDGVLQPGQTIRVGERRWRVANRPIPGDSPQLASRHGLVALLQDES